MIFGDDRLRRSRAAAVGCALRPMRSLSHAGADLGKRRRRGRDDAVHADQGEALVRDDRRDRGRHRRARSRTRLAAAARARAARSSRRGVGRLAGGGHRRRCDDRQILLPARPPRSWRRRRPLLSIRVDQRCERSLALVLARSSAAISPRTAVERLRGDRAAQSRPARRASRAPERIGPTVAPLRRGEGGTRRLAELLTLAKSACGLVAEGDVGGGKAGLLRGLREAGACRRPWRRRRGRLLVGKHDLRERAGLAARHSAGFGIERRRSRRRSPWSRAATCVGAEHGVADHPPLGDGVAGDAGW